MWTAAVTVATPLAFAGGTLLVPDEPEREKSSSALPTAVAETATAATVGRADGAGGVRNVTGKKEVRLASYNAKTGKATLTANGSGKPAVKAGDVIASGRTKQLPHGALVKVTDATPDSGGAVTVAPATLPELLGDATINSATPVSPSGISVKPLIKGVSAAVTKTGAVSPSTTVTPSSPPSGEPKPGLVPPPGAKSVGGTALPPADRIAPAPLPTGSADGRHAVGGELALDLDIPLAEHGFRGTKQGGPTLSGWVHFQPQVIFSYKRDHALSLAPSEASIGIGGAYDYGWKVHASLPGKVDTGRQPLRLPFAEVHVHTTLFVAGFPIVIDADLTYFYQVSASGQVSIDTEQKTTGEVSLGARYRKATGWERLPVATAATTVGKQLRITGTATAKATIGAELKVALYGTVGAELEWAPYLRADVDAEAIPKQRLDWALYAGFDLQGSLFVQLKIFGIPIFEKSFPVPPLNLQWQVAGGTVTPPTARPAPVRTAA